MKKWIVMAMIVLASISAVGADATKGMSVKNGNVLVGTVNDNGAKLQVVGDVSVTGNITSSGIITGNIVNGVTLKYNNTDINSNQALSNVAYLDKTNVFTGPQRVAGDFTIDGALKIGAQTTDDSTVLNLNTERSWAFKQKGTGANAALLLESYNLQKRLLIGAKGYDSYPMEILAGTGDADQYVTIRGKLTNSGVVNILNTTPSTNTSSGALVVSGGVGIGGNIYSGGNIIKLSSDYAGGNNTIQSVNTNAGIASARVSAKSNLSNYAIIEAICSGSTDSLIGHSAADSIFIGNRGGETKRVLIGSEENIPITIGTNNTEVIEIASTGVTNFKNNTVSTGVGNGAVVIAGGLGVGGDIYSGGNITLTSENGSVTTGMNGKFKSIANNTGLVSVMNLGNQANRVADRGASINLITPIVSGDGGRIGIRLDAKASSGVISTPDVFCINAHDGSSLVEMLKITGGTTVEIPKGQLKFPATQSPSSDANTLDDYREITTFIPSVTSVSGSITSYSSSCTYTKIGNVVTVAINVVLTNAGTASGSINISLPFIGISKRQVLSGCEIIRTGALLRCSIGASGGTLNVTKYDNSYIGATNDEFIISGSYLVQ